MYHMRDEHPSVQRSFRVARRTMDLLEEAAAYSGESRNALVDRLLAESVRVQRHPLIRFTDGASGRRVPAVVGTRLKVHQVISTARAEDGDLKAAADYLQVEPRLIQAAVDYYADFAAEVDQDADLAEKLASEEREHWQRAQRAFG
jgi:uncharacterized protein (DUF433 family)